MNGRERYPREHASLEHALAMTGCTTTRDIVLAEVAGRSAGG
ncbi:hypothetical protein ACFU7Y_07635 [Kitasatospora sp. NPDC057542]|nr:hypothetical protein [Streptomyces sp. LS1784]